MAAEELLKDSMLLQRDIQKVRSWSQTDQHVAVAGLEYRRREVDRLADTAYRQRWRSANHEFERTTAAERAIACLQGLGHKRATLEAVSEEHDAIASYHRACRSIAGNIYLYVVAGRLVEGRTEQEATQLTARVFTALDEGELVPLKELFDDIVLGWPSFVESYNSRGYTGYGLQSTRAMPNYLYTPGRRRTQKD